MEELVDRRLYESYWQKLADTYPGDRYLRFHKQRYLELFDNLAYFTRDKLEPRVVEIGVSVFTLLYKTLFANLKLVTVDRPLELGGAGVSFGVEECAATHHYNIDLNEEAISARWGQPPIGHFDYVVFCEVLEHLAVNPVQMFEELLSLLKPDGYLLITTPNFFSLFHLQQIAKRENPQEIFPRRGADIGNSCHIREYTMSELIAFVEEAGGKIVKAEFSDCWHDKPTRMALAEYPEMRSNLLIVAAPHGSPAPVVYVSDRINSTTDIWDLDVAADVEMLKKEIVRLHALVDVYERRRVNRVIKWFQALLGN